MSLLRRWWCVILVENFGLEGYGKKFAHYSEEGRATLSDNVPPTFRISRKRTHASSTMMPLDTDEDHSYNKRPYSFLPKESESHVTMDKEDGSLDGENASFKMLEATVHALAAVLSVSLERAKEMYKCGPEYDWSEMELCAHDLAKNMSEEAQQRLQDFSERFRRALDSKEF
ncbi:hypothetical protein NQZ68_030072 [Dissostichus eleginoides]|nr:hypothetical protein NQZ68_030072 [Dissostichus eleginoides]